MSFLKGPNLESGQAINMEASKHNSVVSARNFDISTRKRGLFLHKTLYVEDNSPKITTELSYMYLPVQAVLIAAKLTPLFKW